MTIENLINKKGLEQLSNNELKKIERTLNKDESIKAIAKWLHYNLKEPKHINQFIGVLKEIADFGCAGASIVRESDYEAEEIKKGYYSDLPYGAWDKNIKELYLQAEEPINEFFCEIQEILTAQNISKCGDLENLILMTTRAYIESTAIKAMELKI